MRRSWPPLTTWRMRYPLLTRSSTNLIILKPSSEIARFSISNQILYLSLMWLRTNLFRGLGITLKDSLSWRDLTHLWDSSLICNQQSLEGRSHKVWMRMGPSSLCRVSSSRISSQQPVKIIKNSHHWEVISGREKRIKWIHSQIVTRILTLINSQLKWRVRIRCQL